MLADGSRVTRLTRPSELLDGEPDWSPDGRSIAYSVCCENRLGASVFVVGRNRARPHRLFSNGRGSVGNPAWSPDGRRIVFDVSYPDHLYVMSSSGKGARSLFSPRPAVDFDPSWSPDGTKLAFVRDYFRVYIMNQDGSNPRMIGRGTGPSWAPDGGQIAVENGLHGIDVVQVESGASRTIVTKEDAGGESKAAPAWSPDGRTIAYLDGSLDGTITLYDLQTGASRGLGVRAWPHSLSWSPDGGRLLYTTTARCDGSTCFAIHSLELASGQSREIVRDARDGIFSPDGRLIAFVRGQGRASEIYVAGADGSGERMATKNQAPDIDPDWQAAFAEPTTQSAAGALRE